MRNNLFFLLFLPHEEKKREKKTLTLINFHAPPTFFKKFAYKFLKVYVLRNFSLLRVAFPLSTMGQEFFFRLKLENLEKCGDFLKEKKTFSKTPKIFVPPENCISLDTTQLKRKKKQCK